MSILGKLANGIGQTACVAVGTGMELAGKAADGIGSRVSPGNSITKGIKEFTSESGAAVRQYRKNVGKGMETVVDTTIEIGGNVGSKLAEGITELGGASQETVNKAKTIGRVAGSAAVGFVAGDAIGGCVTAVTAATGVSSTGTAISALSGAAQANATYAAIGGGALAAGGGGTAAGQALLTGINAISATDGAISGCRQKRDKE